MRISDWSSDGCSSDLLPLCLAIDAAAPVGDLLASTQQIFAQGMAHRDYPYPRLIKNLGRSEERRVGKVCVSTCRSRWSPHHYTNTNIHKHTLYYQCHILKLFFFIISCLHNNNI